jgi:signal transduction histidine kinase
MLIKDITEMKKIEMLKSQFVSMVSHELKAPIAAVSGYLKLLSNNSIALTDEQKKNYIVRSLVRLESLLKMVNDLLDISRMEINTVEREIKKLNLYEIVKSQIELFQFQIKEKNLTVKFETKNNPLTFNADQGDMERLFTNIISNAIKYNKTNGSIEIMMESTNEYLNVIIKDTGIGMKPEEKEKLFQEFFRAKNEKTKNISGTGLGLSIVKRIVDSYAGNIDVFSEFGKGTSVKVSFPLRQ